MLSSKKSPIIIGIISALVTFALLFIGVKYVSGSQVDTSNVLAYIIFSTIVGGIAALLNKFKLNISLNIFIFGLVIAFVEMYRAFLSDMTGWGDLIGVMSMMTWIIIGLVAGLFFELVYHLYKKKKK